MADGWIYEELKASLLANRNRYNYKHSPYNPHRLLAGMDWQTSGPNSLADDWPYNNIRNQKEKLNLFQEDNWINFCLFSTMSYAIQCAVFSIIIIFSLCILIMSSRGVCFLSLLFYLWLLFTFMRLNTAALQLTRYVHLYISKVWKDELAVPEIGKSTICPISDANNTQLA